MIKKVEIFFGNTKIISTFAPQSRNNESNRNVAQLVAHYVRDVGVACSSHVISTNYNLRGNPVHYIHKRQTMVRLFFLFYTPELSAGTGDHGGVDI